MGQRQIVTRTQIAKMAGTDVTHFLNQRARFAAKSYGGRAGLKNVGVHLINLPVGAVAHDIRNTGSTHMICLVVGQRLEFDIIDYPEQNKRLYRYAGQPPDLVDIAAVSHPRLSDHHG